MNNTYICAIIPALNEEETISAIVKRLLDNNVSEVFVVDNGSTDNTARISQRAGATVIHEEQRGYGKACLSGIVALPDKCDWVLFCDADGSDDLTGLSLFWELTPDHDFILGNRRATESGRQNLTPVQNFGNWLSGALMKLGWGKGFSDLGPLRLIRRDALNSLNMQDENFGWTVEMQAKALEQGLKTAEIPVNYLPRQGGESKISGNWKASFQAGTIILSTLGTLWLNRPLIQKTILIFSLLLLLTGATVMGLLGDPASATKAPLFFTGAGLMVAGFILSLLRKNCSLSIIMITAIITRVLLLPIPPGDDVWRYIWEGLIQNNGFNPYNSSPDHASLIPHRTEWWNLINHPGVTAIYPPLAQLLFRIISSISATLICFKLFIVLADLATGWLLLKRYGQRSILYLLNPMVIYTFAGGAHYESLFILPLVAAWLMWEPNHKNHFLIGALIGASISIKIVSILAGGFILWRLCISLFQKKPSITNLTLYLAGLISIPFLSYTTFTLLSGKPDSLYPEDFTDIARNTSLIPWIAEYFNNHPYDFIPNKAFILPLILVLIPITLFSRKLSSFMGRSLLAVLAFSPMVHAWYLVWAVPFALKKHTFTIIGLSITGFLYFLYPYRFASVGAWEITTLERTLFWSPLLLLCLDFYIDKKKRPQ